MKKILVVGGEFSNKGAELMIHSVREQIANAFPNSRVFLTPTLASHKKIEDAGFEVLNFPLFHVGYKTPKVFSLSIKYPFLIKNYLSLKGKASFKGDVSLKDIDVVFDISGYAFGKKWGLTPLVNVNTLIKKVVSNGSKYVFLPQALGPFSDDQIPLMKECITLSSLIIARDNVSHKAVLEISDSGTKNKVLCFPDITLAYGVELNKNSPKNYCCIVPNIRMLDRGGAEWKEKYYPFLETAIDYILNNSELEVKIVNHSASDDKKLVEELGDRYAENTRISKVYEDDPRLLKKMLGGSAFNLASRFHAVASSLSGTVPCIMTSWSHKYRELANDFSVDEYCLETPDFNKVRFLLGELLDENKNEVLREKILKRKENIVNKNIEMWRLIQDAVN